MRINILGLGWFGLPLAKELLSSGHSVGGSTRTDEKKRRLAAEGIATEVLDYPSLPDPALLDADVIILNIPPFSEQLKWFQSWQWNKRTWIIFISSTSVYPSPDSQGAILLSEQEVWISAHFSNWTILRFGGLIGPGRHPGKYLSGKRDLKGRLWPVNLITLEDTIGVTMAVLQKKILCQTIEVVHDEHPSREEFYTSWCRENNHALPEFDQADHSTGKLVPNEKLKTFYSPSVSLWSV